jgi:hypothetical protein
LFTSERAAPSGESVIEITGIGIINVFMFAMPQFVWLAATAVFRLSWRVCDAGLLAAEIMLLALGVLLTFQTTPDAGRVLWVIYLPVAIIASVLTALVARASAPRA